MRVSFFTLEVKYVFKYIFCIVILLNAKVAAATITVHSIATTISSCSNNGTATIVATSSKPNPSLFYEIVSGPTTAAIQTVPVFSSLFPGTYTVRIYDIDFVYREQQFTITGNYKLPDINLQITAPFCLGSANGKIVGSVLPGKGKAPFTWDLTSPASSIITQTTNVFNNLSAGNYVIKLTDACGNYQTRTAIILDRGTGLSHTYNGVPTITKIGCDSMLYNMDVKILKDRSRYPLTLTLTRGDGSSTVKTVYPIPVDTINYEPALYVIRDTILNISYNDYLHGCLKDVCGYEICATKDSIAPFDFDVAFNTSYFACGYNLTGHAVYNSISGKPFMNTAFRSPLSVTLRDVSTNALVDSAGCNNSFCSLYFSNGITSNTYILRITDGCGQVFQRNIQWPAPIIDPASVGVSIGKGCLDSTSVANFNLKNFGAPVTIQILSGPSKVESTKPGYRFSYPITYPKTFFANSANGYSIKNMAAGTYSYKVTDTCGTIVNGSFIIPSSNLNSMSYTYTLTKGCAGNNVLKFNATNSNATGIVITNVSTNTDLYKRAGVVIPDSITSLQAGKYLLKITYGTTSNASITDGPTSCAVLTDTIRIKEKASNSNFQSHTSILCNNINYVEIHADSTFGIPPYQYEINNGPTTFPLQSRNVFQLPTYGEYSIRIRDACGNSNAKQISVDSAKFAPILRIGATCRGNRIVLKAITSTFFEYDWKRPNGSIYTGDSLIINAFSPADTGLYIIEKRVNINGCVDTFQSSYHLKLPDVYRQTITFCEGNSLTIGTKIFTTSGVYTDTLQNQEGCDSIRIITLTMLPKKIDTANVRICNGEHIILGGNTYNQPGLYKDSIQNAYGCYEITVTKLEVNGYPDTIQTAICEGTYFSIADHTYTLTGFYTDTLRSSFGCDSVIVTDLIVLPIKRTTINRSICTGQSITIGVHTYNQTGIYRDTLSTSTCDSIVTLNLTVLKPFDVISVHDTAYCFDEGVLTLTANTAQSFIWMPSKETTQSIEITQAGTYSVTATDINQCSYTEQINVTEFCETKIFVPTGFTPNNDGLHDDVEIFGKHFTDFKITIFNRWGEIVFISTDRDIRWDGTYRGELMPSGSYPWIISYTSTLDPEHKEHVIKGSITLVR
ncbi:gliding motility-associated C-terminal domain-containing protein [Cytophaga aurantiaca]|uniref:gliding motility-associated C-terminal domain-containing protein n=1 Tax=Cytophaga aurantiaca TaxID=29530 RepID=UPI0005265139|nr:gliding motility-associated C-terminal domain-containing protein [Cytophaga aurantiaca]